ncbi:hypothetical protein GTP58_04440 [Duganella sp. CY15W]|uniref:hypothetical protein n=1 Tax=Duganella sp. CY15W TaxID=2692172 RepID=UPI001371B8FA|nr:hypothetical protein [Duganella sp. CY15W]MYM27559.1 hypothetical protein [Duganella sp. CY15W]
MRESEPDFYMADCFDARRASCRYAGCCQVQQLLARASDTFLATLDEVTLADLVLSA